MGWWQALGDDGTTKETTFYADSYDGVVPGPRASFSYETQEGIPVDGSSKIARNMSPFTIRLLPPSLDDFPASFQNESGTGLVANRNVQVDTYQAAGSSMSSNQKAASDLLASYGVSSVANSASVANTLNQQISAGQFINTASGTQVRTTLTDSTTAMDIAAQVAAMVSTPPLTLLVNPNNMAISYVNIQSYQERGREGFIFQRWGEDQPTIKFSGKTGAFIAGEAPRTISNASVQAFREEGTTTTPTGVQFASKRNSAAFQNFQTLYQIYRNNGYIYDRVGKSEAHLAIGTVAIDYDQFTYIGQIESFDYAYDTTQIHAIEWSMEFRVSVMYDNAQTPSVVTPLTAPIPNPTDPGGAASPQARGNSAEGWLALSGDPATVTDEFTNYISDYGQPPIFEADSVNVVGESDSSLVVANPDGTLQLTNPNVGG